MERWPQQSLEMVALDQASWAAMLRLVQAVSPDKGDAQSFLNLLELQPHALAGRRMAWVNFRKIPTKKKDSETKGRAVDEHNQNNPATEHAGAAFAF